MSARLAAAVALAAGLSLAACARRAPEPQAPRADKVARFDPIPESQALHGANPHDHGGKPLCQRCHRPGEAGIVDEPIALCARCHDPARMKHPFGVPPSTAPGDLPLADGRIVCHTCHDPHDVKARRSGLRLDYGALCARCHVAHGAKPAAAPPHR